MSLNQNFDMDSSQHWKDFNHAKKSVIQTIDELRNNLSSRLSSSKLIRHEVNIRQELDMYLEEIKTLIINDLVNLIDIDYIKFIDNNIIPLETDQERKLVEKENYSNDISILKTKRHIVDGSDKDQKEKIDYIYTFLKTTFLQLEIYVNHKKQSNSRIQNITAESIKFQDYYRDKKNKEDELIKKFKIISNELNVTNNENKILTEKLYELENTASNDIYDIAANKYRKSESNYRKLFFFTIASLLVSTLLLIAFKVEIIQFLTVNSDNIGNSQVEFWAIKISIMVIGITLISYFLKQSSHYQRLADQNYQTQVELKAFPSFMNSVPPDQTIEIRKELALKYFGKEIDGSDHKDMSNLISDQMKNTTEMVKATTDAIKNLNSKNQS